MDIVWDQFLTIIRQEVGSRVVDTWFKVVLLKRWDIILQEVYLEAPNTFVKDWLHKNYLTLCQTHLARLFKVPVVKVIIYAVNEACKKEPAVVVIDPEANKGEPQLYKPAKVISFKRAQVNTGYSFDNFIKAPHNFLAYAAAQAISEKPGKLYNPLFIYSESGLGKTHLLHAIGGSIKKQNQKATVLYQATDRFVSEFINAVRLNKVHQFEEKYQSVDVLLFDDIQLISNKGQTQEAFFHIFNLLHGAHKQIVFSGDTFPENMNGIAERLRSRFASGLVTNIYEPSLETKVAILKKKAELSNEKLDDDVTLFIAQQSNSNIRDLEGAFVRVLAFASLTKQSITLELAHKVLLRVPAIHKKKLIDMDTVVKTVNKYYNSSKKELCSKSRNKTIALVRHIAMYLIKHLTDKSLRDIGLFFGSRDHTSVVYALEKVERYKKENTQFNLELRHLEQEILR